MNKLATMIFGLAGFASVAVAQTNNVTSTVISAATGEPVSGASVVVTGTDIATTTDINGKFSIDAPKEYKTLTVSHNNLQPAVVNILPEPIVMREANGLMSGWGVEVGLSSTTWNIEDADDIDRRSGLTLGITYDYPIKAVPNLSVMGGLFYIPNGYRIGDDGKVNADYLELQATAKYSYTLPVLNNDLKAFALAGPYFSLGLGGKCESGFVERYDDDDVSTFDLFKRTDIGLVLGFGVEYKRYSLTFRWGIGMKNIYDADKIADWQMEYDYNKYYQYEFADMDFTLDDFKEKYGDEYRKNYDDISVKNSNFMLTLGYRF